MGYPSEKQDRVPVPAVAEIRSYIYLKRYILASVIVVLGAFHLLGSLVPASIFPNLTELFQAFYTQAVGQGEYNMLEHAGATVIRIVLTFLIAVPLGMAIGIAMGLSRFAETALSPHIAFSLAFPSIVWAYLGVLWFGLTTHFVPVFVGVLITLPYVIINSWEGTKALDPSLLEMARSYDASNVLILREILIPHLSPYIFTLTRITLTVAWKIMLVAEIFGAQSGLGFVINEIFVRQRNDLLLVWTIPALVVVFLLERGLRRVEQRYEWRNSGSQSVAPTGA